jgi:hypothetical protein
MPKDHTKRRKKLQKEEKNYKKKKKITKRRKKSYRRKPHPFQKNVSKKMMSRPKTYVYL